MFVFMSFHLVTSAGCCTDGEKETFSTGLLHGVVKGILHLKMKILSSFTHPQVVANLYEFLSSAEYKGRYMYFEE